MPTASSAFEAVNVDLFLPFRDTQRKPPITLLVCSKTASDSDLALDGARAVALPDPAVITNVFRSTAISSLQAYGNA